MDGIKTTTTLLCVLCALLGTAGCATTLPESATATPASAESTATADAPAATAPTPAASTAEQSTQIAAKPPAAEPKPVPDLWARIRAGYGMAPLDSSLVTRHEQWFVNNPEYVQAMLDRARLYLYYIVDEVEKRKIPLEIALLPAIESAYKPYAYSRARAAGLWQFIAPTGRLYGLKTNWWYEGRRDVMASTQAALDYLEKLRDQFHGDWHLALAAYNAGEGRVERMIEYNRKKGLPTSYQYLKLRAETLNYVPRLMAMANIVAHPEKYGMVLASIPNRPFFAQVDVGSQIDLGVVSRLTEIPVDELLTINPHLNRWATDPNGPHQLLIPVDKKDSLLAGLSNLPEQERMQWRGHEVKRGDTMSDIARRYGVAPEIIRAANNLRSNLLSVGQSLMIPVSARPLLPVALAPAAKPAMRPANPARAHNGSAQIIHQVRAGDTLWSIARRYGVLVSQIVNWNLLEPSDILRLGQKLRIFANGEPAAIGANG